MGTVACFVGLDYHQDAVQVCVLDAAGRQLLNRSCANDWREIAGAAASVGVVKRAAVEACCGAADLSEELSARAGWHVDLAHPGYVERMKRSPDKTDYTDGRMLADLTRVGYLPKVWLASAYERDLRGLVNHRQSLVDQRRAAKLRVGAVLREHRAKPPKSGAKPPSRRTRAWVAWAASAPQLSGHARWVVAELLGEVAHLDGKVLAADARLRGATADDPKLGRLMNEPGVGEVTAWVLRAYVGRFDRFASGKQLSRYCGLSPCNASSGARRADAGLVRGCNKLLRATLIQAAHRLKRTEPRWRGLAESMRARGKCGGVVAAAVANRRARGLWHRMNERAAEEPTK
jgi:transposase